MNNLAIDRVSIESSSLASVGYHRGMELLEVEFKSGALYRYENVPGHLYDELLSAESKGAFFNTCIRNFFRFLRAG